MTDFTGGNGDDSFVGSETSDTATGGGGSDTLIGNGGNDDLAGDDGGDYLEGGAGDDTLYSGFRTTAFNSPYYGNSWTAPILDTGIEVDTLLGGDGSDTIFAGYGDNVDGGSNGSYGDSLYISLMGATAGVAVDFGLASVTIGGGTITGIENVNWVEGSNFDDDITMGSGNGYGSFAPVFGMGGNDRLVAGYYTGTLWGGDGNDIVDGRGSQYLQLVDGGAGDDTLYTNSNTFGSASGGDGNDTIYAHGTINGDAGNDTIYIQQSYYAGQVHGGAGDDIIYAPLNQGVSAVFGDDGNDQLFGGNLDDTLDGGAGNDILDGGTGINALIGGAGNDRLVVGAGADGTVVNGGVDFDTLVVSGAVTIGGALIGIEALELNVGNLTLSGSQFNTGLAANAQISGTGSVTINMQPNFSYSSAQLQSVAGSSVNFTVNGSASNDVINASGTISHTINGGAGADQITGSLGNDTASYASNTGAIYADLGGNYVGEYAVTTGTVTGAEARLSLDTVASIENIIGSAFGDRIYGSGVDNIISGGAGNDIIYGEGGNDLITGGTGADVLGSGPIKVLA
jgi:Ca2+-binding RTX toxin-like protein